MNHDLYNTAILTLASGIPHIGRLDHPQGKASKTARLCGSVVTVELCLNDTGEIEQFAQTVKACALGQAAAAILGQHVMGASGAELRQGRDDLWAMLRDGTPMPSGRFSDLSQLAAVHGYRQRHTSTALAFDAVVDAYEQAKTKKQVS